MMAKNEPQIDAIGLEGEDLTVTFTDGDKGKYSPQQLIDLATENETLTCLDPELAGPDPGPLK